MTIIKERKRKFLKLETPKQALKALEDVINYDPITSLEIKPLRQKNYPIFHCPKNPCNGNLHAVGYVSYGILYICDKCGSRYRRH